ncbi:carbohydrate binding protein with CBM9 domain [Roseimicrobium gellanilyticum]|uniref:Carbohydrate binding protein with CBM9 domain n=1 Tax=Roseimicrobium gellanilyticum TaxID=748857 RepID=A0A366H8X6_9BACT|nr:carbohydrate binding family 9 domain-containing protein [Roseimicrobium gellanilyticum]RBP38670.1 carbohydrate binding protein with CBM9 domain [Roseimicrobium gellanilyticum]
MISFLRQHFLVFCGFLLGLECLHAETPSVRTLELKDGLTPPELDGVLSDPCWEKAETVSAFTQVFPKEGAIPSEGTVVKFAHDGRYLYVAIRCHDREPDRITARDLQRDSFEEESFPADDHVQVALDPFGRERDGFLFAVNPLGAMTDGRIEHGGSTAKEWDGIWDARAQRDAEGWTAELRIPFSTLSFDPAKDSWGVNVQRVIRRKEEMIRWTQPSQSREGDWLDDIARIEGMSGLNQGLGIELKPYTVFRHLDEVDGEGSTELRAGFDANWLITPALTATLTVNTDFAEAEVDDRQINLTRFPLFFPEKRDFFLRDAPYFSFPYGTALMMPFFSRTIGRSAEGEPVDILVGAKFTGRAGPYTIGILDVQQDSHDGIDEKNLLVARVTRELAADHTLGAIITHGDPYSNGDNTVLGLDYQWRTSTFMGDKNFDLQAWLIGSDTTDMGTGTTFGGTFGYTNQPWYLYGIFAQIDGGFYPAMGYLARQGVREYYFVATYQWQINRGGLRTFELEVLPIIITRLDGEIETADISLPGLEWGWDSGAELSVWLSLKEEQFFEPFEIQPGVVVPVGDYKFQSVQMEYEGAPSRVIAPNMGMEIGEFLNGDIIAWNVGLEYRPSPYLHLGLSYAEQAVDLPQGEFTTRLASVNLNLAFSPRLSWNTLAQYDNESDSFGVNSRIRWTVRPGTDVYLVLNQGYVVEERNRLRRVGSEAALKAGVTWRF